MCRETIADFRSNYHRVAVIASEVPDVVHAMQKLGSDMAHKVFVYGTLKSGEPNHNLISDPTNGMGTYLGNGMTATKYPLIIGTRYNIPFLLYKPGFGQNVSGEIYEVDQPMLEKLDELEDHPNWYQREIDDIQVVNSDQCEATIQSPVKCWVYFLKTFRADLLNQPMLPCYKSAGDHGLPYCERYSRDPNISPKDETR